MQINFYRDEAATQPDPGGLFWRGCQAAEVGTDSQIVEKAWVRWGALWGRSTFRIVAWDETHPIGEAPPNVDWWLLPVQTRKFSAEGRRDHCGVQVDVSLLQLAK